MSDRVSEHIKTPEVSLNDEVRTVDGISHAQPGLSNTLASHWNKIPKMLRRSAGIATFTLVVLNLEETFKFLHLDRFGSNAVAIVSHGFLWLMAQTWLPTLGATYLGTLLALITFAPVFYWIWKRRI